MIILFALLLTGWCRGEDPVVPELIVDPIYFELPPKLNPIPVDYNYYHGVPIQSTEAPNTPGTHSIFCAKSLRPDSDYQISLSIYKPIASSFNFKATITDANLNTVDTLNEDGLNFQGLKSFQLKIGDLLPETTYSLTLNASGSLNFHYSQQLPVNAKHLSLFIQTDKTKYKPGQLVLFRVVAIDPQLKPIDDPIDITITDNFGNRIMQVTQQNNSGVVTNSLQLSDQTPLGTWEIKAVANGLSSTKNFFVDEYVLPKFEVKIDLPKYFLVNINNPSQQKDFIATISAIYTYGKPVEGSVTVTLQMLYTWGNVTTIERNLQLVNGQAQLILSLKELSSLSTNDWPLRYGTFLVSANAVEDATGIVLSTNDTFQFTTEKYNLIFLELSPNNFKPGLIYTAFIQLSQKDGSPPLLADIADSSDKLSVVNVNVDFTYSSSSTSNQLKMETFAVTLTESGYMSFAYPIPAEVDSCNFRVEFFESESNSTISAYKYISAFKTRDHQNIQIIYTNPEGVIKPGTTAHFKVKSNQELNTYNYYILGKGLLYKTESISGISATEHNLDVEITNEVGLDLAPQLKIVVTMLTSTNELVADSISVTIVDYFENKVSLAFNVNSTLPGKNVILNVNSKPNSFIGILAVDKSVILLASGNDITKEMVMNDISQYSQTSSGAIYNAGGCRFCRMWWPWFPSGKDTSTILDNSGVAVLGDVYIYIEPVRFPIYMPMFAMRAESVVMYDAPVAGQQQSTGEDHVRTDFPETWIWTDLITSSNGSYAYSVKVPDTMTSWVATAFATHPIAGLAIVDNSIKITVLKKFFVSLNLPYSVVRGEEFALQVSVFNYLDQDTQATVTLSKSSEFFVRDCKSTKNTTLSAVQNAMIKVQNNSVTTVYFWIVPVKIGYINIAVSARALSSIDSMIAKLLVKPEGEPQSYSTSELIQSNGSSSTYTKSFNVTLPSPTVLVKDSVYIEVTLIGNIMGSSLNGLDNLLGMPYGCGEQNMLNFAPDVYILLYLDYSNQATSDIATKAKGFINSGYQRELTYQRNDGSFSAFGNSDLSGSVWLSSFVAKCFHQAKNFIPVQDEKIARTLNWIISNQALNGSFIEPNNSRVIHTDMQGGSASGVALTAYVVISLLENLNLTQTAEESISKALNYLEANYDDYSSSPYALSIIGYAFQLSGSSKLDDVITKLKALAINAGGTTHWKETVTVVSNSWTPGYTQTKAVNIETTGYVLLIFASQGDLATCIPIVKWLITQRNSNGGFASTQDTVIALEALAQFSRIMPGMKPGSGLKVVISNNVGKPSYTFKNITSSNSLILQSYQVPAGTTKVNVAASGAGNGLLQLNVKYNVLKLDSTNSLSLAVTTALGKGNLVINICTAWNGNEISGMVLIEVNLLSGYSFSDEENLKKQIGSVLKKIDADSSKVVLYFDELNSTKLCFNMTIDQIKIINNLQSAAIKVYRYYDPNTKVTKFYKPTTSIINNWLTSCPLCCANGRA